MFKNVIAYRALQMPVIILFAMWGGYLLQVLGFVQQCEGALIPRVPDGLKGIFFSPFLHGSIEHIFSNTVPMGILLFLLYQFYQKIADKILITGWVATGFLVWLLPPFSFFGFDNTVACIIGASGIVYFLAFFLFFSGVFRWNMKLLTISLIVALYYGSLIWGIFPEEFFLKSEQRSTISWQSHLSGAVIGFFMAFIFRGEGEKKKKFIWEFPNYYSEKDDKLWQEYISRNPEDFNEMPVMKKNSVWDHLDELKRNTKP